MRLCDIGKARFTFQGLMMNSQPIARRIFRIVDFVGIGLWWLLSFGAASVIANAEASLFVRIGLGLMLWVATLAAPSWIIRRQTRLDEMQTMILWRTLGGSCIFIMSYLVAMAAYFTIIGIPATALITMIAMAPPMAVAFAAFLSAVIERASEKGDEAAEV